MASRPDPAARGGLIRLGDRVMEGVRHGPDAAGYASARGLLLAMCMSAMGRGFTFDDVVRAVDSDPRFEWAGAHMSILERRKGRAAARLALLERWQTAERRRLDPISSRDDVIRYWSDILLSLPAVSFPGKGGPGQLAALMVIAVTGLVDYDIHPGVRREDFEILSGLSHATIERATRSLAGRGLLEAIPPTQVGHRTRWRIDKSAVSGLAAPIVGYFKGGVGGTHSITRLLPNHPVWAGQQLKHGHWHVHLLLEFVDGASVEELARISGYNVGTIRGRLDDLAEHMLVTHVGDDEWRPGPADIDDVATKLGLPEVAERRAHAAKERAEARRQWVTQREKAIAPEIALREWRERLYAETQNLPGRRHGGLRWIVIDDSREAFRASQQTPDAAYQA